MLRLKAIGFLAEARVLFQTTQQTVCRNAEKRVKAGVENYRKTTMQYLRRSRGTCFPVTIKCFCRNAFFFLIGALDDSAVTQCLNCLRLSWER